MYQIAGISKNPNSLSSNDIREYLVKGGQHPANLFPDLFSVESPEAGLTYEWTLTFEDIFTYFSVEQLEATCRDWGLKDQLSLKTRIWIDILFIDQVRELACSSRVLYPPLFDP